jgi:hypothetical protein
MYVQEKIDVSSGMADSAVVPPYYVFVALPEYISPTATNEHFSIMETLWNVFHISQRTPTLFQPRVWAPAWSDAEIHSYLTRPLPEGFWPFAPLQPLSLRAKSFLEPSEAISEEWFKPPCYDIVHVVCIVQNPRPGRFWLDDGNKTWSPEDLAKKLDQCRTRLFILQCSDPNTWPSCREFAKNLVQAGAAAALVMGGPVDFLRSYCTKIYGDISHNRPLSEATSVPEWMESTNSSVFFIRLSDGDSLLQLDGWIGSLSEQLRYWQKAVETQNDYMLKLHVEAVQATSPFVHSSQLEKVTSAVHAESEESGQLIRRLGEQLKILSALPPQPWHHESEGSLVISGATHSLRSLRPQLGAITETQLDIARASLGSLSAEEKFPFKWQYRLQEEVHSAPRVLNAGFRVPGEEHMISEKQPLLAGHDYELLVDIGPRWDKLQSLVTGSAEFPEKALPPDDYGYLIDVVFLSEDFSPPLVTGRIFLPAHSGRSRPWHEGAGTPTEGALILKVRAPDSPKDPAASIWLANGRLGLYHENNLLQCAQVRMSVRGKQIAFPRVPNVIDVDYVLSGGFQDVGNRFAKRKVHFTEDDTWEETKGEGHPLAMSITLNDDGSGSHRILVMSQNTDHLDLLQRAAWMNYDPVAASKLLQHARADLLDCFFVKETQSGQVLESTRANSSFSLTAGNSQPKGQFKWDLVRLAERGDALFKTVFSSLQLADGAVTEAAQTRFFAKALQQPRVIQVARTGPANYVFPWALLYEIPISHDRSQNRFCDVLKEWDDNGIRRDGVDGKDHSSACPFAAEAWHQCNVYCPYGF